MSSQHRKGGADPFGDLDQSDLPPVALSAGDLAVYGERPLPVAPEPRLKVTKVGLQGYASTFEEWEAFGRTLKEIEAGLQWAVGDWLNQGETRWREKYLGVADALGFDYQTLRDYSYVARQVNLSIRIDKLSFAHHRLVASYDPPHQKLWLARAATGENGKAWSLARMREMMADPDGSKKTSFDWYSQWFARRIDGIFSKARKATDAEKRLVAADLRRMADELEGKKS